MRELIPCACGCKETKIYMFINLYVVECRSCGALVHGRSHKAVAENWNRRIGILHPARCDEENA